MKDIAREIETDFGISLPIQPPAALPPGLPPPLQELYSICNGANLGFATLFSPSDALQHSMEDPFAPDWIPFGITNLGEFWLCARQSTSGEWLSVWDHDFDDEIEPIGLDDLSKFLREEYLGALRSQNNTSNRLVIESLPQHALAQTVIALKQLTGSGTAELRQRLASLPISIEVTNGLIAKELADRLRGLGVGCRLKFDFFIAAGASPNP